MRPKDARNLLESCIAVQQPAFLWGGPGIGKSDIIKSIAKEQGIPLLTGPPNLFFNNGKGTF
jgi:MoxR-like ATPase